MSRTLDLSKFGFSELTIQFGASPKVFIAIIKYSLMPNCRRKFE